jgi:hypothetical protein
MARPVVPPDVQTVTVSRTVDATPDAVRAAMADVGAFMRAADFDEVAVEGDAVRITNRVGLPEMSLDLVVVEDAGAELAYEQRDGIFEEMRTRYEVAPADGGTEVTATTEFALDLALVGGFLDATVVKHQRRRELESQFDSLAGLDGE